KHRDVVQRVVDGLVASERPRMPADHLAVLPELHALGVGTDLDGTPDRAGLHRVAALVEADEARLGDRGRHRMEAVERPGVGHQPRTFLLEDLPDGPVAQLGMRVRPGPGDAAVQEPGVELRVGPEPRPRYEEPTPDHPDLVLDLS